MNDYGYKRSVDVNDCAPVHPASDGACVHGNRPHPVLPHQKNRLHVNSNARGVLESPNRHDDDHGQNGCPAPQQQ